MLYGCGIDNTYMDWLGTMGLAILSTFFLLSIVYMIAQVMKREEWVFWAKSQLYQTIIACLMIASVSFFASFSCGVSESIAGGDPFIVVDQYLTSLFEKIVSAVGSFYDLARRAFFWSAFMFGLWDCTAGFCFQPLAGLSVVGGNLELLGSLITPFAASLFFQKIILQFVREFAFLLILPIGFILKVIPLTRTAGAFLMALAVAFYIVFPLTYLMNKVVMDKIANDPIYRWCDADPGNLGGVLQQISGSAFCRPFQTVGQILPQAVFLPALNLIITVTFMQAMFKVFSRDYLLE